MNCRFIDKTSQWLSSVHNEPEFNAVWRPYACDYQEFTTEQLQQCVTKRKIVAFQKNGASVADYVDEFVSHRLDKVTMYPDTQDPDALTIVFDTLSLLHSNGPDGMLEETVSKLPAAPANEEHYWLTGFFLSSEREVVRAIPRRDVAPITSSKTSSLTSIYSFIRSVYSIAMYPASIVTTTYFPAALRPRTTK